VGVGGGRVSGRGGGVADVKSNKPIPADAKLEYEWSFLVGGGNFTSGSALALNGNEVTLDAKPASASSAQRQFDFTVSATTAQPEVFVGSPANLVASYTVSSTTATGKPRFKWSQLPGPRAALSNPGLASVFVVPGEAGTLVFAVEVTIAAGAIEETRSSAVTVRANAVRERGAGR